VLSLSLWYHFSFVVVSIALLGTGMSGVGLSALRSRAGAPADRLRVFAALAFAFVAWFGFLAAERLEVHPESLPVKEGEALLATLFRAAFVTQAPMLWLDLLFLAPFLAAGLALGATFTARPDRVASLYAADLAGAAGGAGAALFFLPSLGAQGLIAAAAAVAALSAAAVAFRAFPRAALALAATATLALAAAPFARDVAEIKIEYSKRQPKGGAVVADGWSALGYSVAVDERAHQRIGIYVDFVCYTPIHRFNGRYEDVGWVVHERLAPLLNAAGKRVLVIGSGGGRDVLAALHRKARHVTAIEVNPTIVSWVTGRFATEAGGLFADPRVTLVRAEGRGFLRHSLETYDVIMLQNTLTQTAAAAGAFNLAEDYLLTTGAVREYLDHLAPGGILYVRRPYVEVKRLVTLFRQAFEEARPAAAPFADCVAVGDMGGPYPARFVLLKKGALEKSEIAGLRSYLKSEKGAPFYLPGGSYRNSVAKLVTAPDLAPLLESAETDIRPPTDDRPFFSQRAKLDRLTSPELQEVRGRIPQSAVLLLVVLIQSSAVALVFLALPFVLLPASGVKPFSRRAAAIAYFSLLGLAFAAVEIGLLQRATLVVGDPTRTFAIVLLSLLLGSGAGSLATSRLAARGLFRAAPAVLLVTLLLALQFGWPRLSAMSLGWSDNARALFVGAVGFLLGVPMGTFFPSGIQALASEFPRAVPMAWAANGFFSVVGAAAATCGGVFFGFDAVALCAAGAYALAGVTSRLLTRRPAQSTA